MPEKKRAAEKPRRRSRDYRAYEVAGLELEYSIVDEKLRPRCGVEDLFAALSGRRTSDVELDSVGLSNELAAHVLEMKTPPERSLVRAERRLAAGVREASATLRDEFGWRLLPTGMHPLMRPSQTRLWSRGGQRIYRTYARLFGIREHGWLNVQSCQVNLPFGTPEEATAMHNAAAALIAYLPALAASSPIVEGHRGPALSSRMAFYAKNQASIPVLTGGVIPEYVDSLDDYRKRIFGRIYAALDEVPGTRLIRHEWVNSRGVILRFDRSAMEVRVLDLQECPKMDVAIAAFVRGALASLSARLRSGDLALPDRRLLLVDYRNALVKGRDGAVSAQFLGGRRRPRTARAVLEGLLDDASRYLDDRERPYLRLVEQRLARGNLAERILTHVERVGASRRRDAIVALYGELADCLEANTPWLG
jgi:gamma-glutamyl:cysteine ligase YbdK (ATP-grasp superfamily)